MKTLKQIYEQEKRINALLNSNYQQNRDSKQAAIQYYNRIEKLYFLFRKYYDNAQKAA
jgi:hypothetical protein